MFLRLEEDGITVRTGITCLLERVLLPEELGSEGGGPDLDTRLRAHRAYQDSLEGASLEVPLEMRVESGGFAFVVSGRADAVQPGDPADRVTEVKTVATRAEAEGLVPRPSHLMQLCFYARALEASGRTVTARLALVPCDRGEAPLELEVDPHDPALEAEWTGMFEAAADLLRMAVDRRTSQLAALERLDFPYPERRPGQLRIEEICRRTVAGGGRTLLEAPTGTGKTAAVLTGALREALPADLVLFLLTSKNTQRRIAVETMHALRGSGLPVTAVVLEARERMCLSGSSRCRAPDCAFGCSFGSRVRSAGLLRKLVAAGVSEPGSVRGAAEDAGVCPFELSLALSLHCDLVVCDYNYVFDPGVYLRRFFAEPREASRCVLLVDEAANLPSRAREYWSPALSSGQILALPSLRGRLARFRKLVKPIGAFLEEAACDPGLDGAPEAVLPEGTALPLRPEAWAREAARIDGSLPDPLFDLMMSVVRMARTAQVADGRFDLLCRLEGGGAAVQWFCKDASAFTGERFDSCHSSVCFSATLRPAEHWAVMLGLGGGAVTESVPWPFPVRNLAVLVDRFVDTRYRARRRTLRMLVRRIMDLYGTKPGTWLVFFPSFEYLEMAAGLFASEGAPVLVQGQGLDQAGRDAFMADVEEGDHLVLTVSGGIFAEGVDLRAPSRRGAVIVGPSIPPPDLRNGLLSAYWEDRGMDGFLTASVIPGMSRVIQAAGRLVRNAGDRGVIVLLDPRFADEPYSCLLPTHWTDCGRPEMLSWTMREVIEFWDSD